MVQKVAVKCEFEVNPAVNGYHFRRISQRKEREGLCLSSAVPKIQTLTPTALWLLGSGKPLLLFALP